MKYVNQHYLMDCIEFLKGIPSDVAKYINADPPYYKIVGDDWDNQWESEDEYLSWCTDWTAESVRILAPGRMLSVWGTLKSDTFLRYKLEVLNSMEGMFPQEEVIWHYNWGGRSSKNFARKHEYCWNYSKGEKFLFNADDVRVERKVKINPRTGEPYENGTIPTCVWEQNNHTMSKDFCNWHSTTKNIEVISRMIKAYSDPGDLIVDPFAGSGTTIISAIRTGRRYAACEKNIEYYKKSIDRIYELTAQGDLFIKNT